MCFFSFLQHVLSLFFHFRLCIVFLGFSCIGYAMPFILCTTICCCLPCIISVLGIREDFSQNRGASQELINSLPTYKFKAKKNKGGNGKENSTGTGEGGIVAAGTEHERVISGEDAVSFISLSLKNHFIIWKLFNAQIFSFSFNVAVCKSQFMY